MWDFIDAHPRILAVVVVIIIVIIGYYWFIGTITISREIKKAEPEKNEFDKLISYIETNQ